MSKLSQIRSRLEMRMLCDKVYTTRARRPPLRSIVVLSDESPLEIQRLIDADKRLRKTFEVRIETLQDDLFKLHVQKQVWGKPVSGHAILDRGTDGCWIAYTDEKGPFMERALEALFNGLYPQVSRAYFNYQQIQKFLDAIKEAYKGSSVVTHVAYKRQARREKSQRRGTRLLWEPGAEADLQDDFRKYRIWIESLAFHVKIDEDIVVLEASLSGRGIAQLKFGTFDDFFLNVVQLYIGLATKWKQFFSHRERRVEKGEVKLSPYMLQYQFDFERPQIEHLVKSLTDSYSHSILFGENPYFVANLTDYRDGSSFYLTVLGPKVIITPMLRSSPFALWRIASRVQHIVGDAQVLEAPSRVGM